MKTLYQDGALIEKILQKDRRALFVFYRRYTPQLSTFINHKVGNPHDAEEILQDTLFAFLEAIRDFHGSSSISTFLFSICRHKIIDWYRRRKIRQVVFSQAPGLESLVSPMLNPEEEFNSVLLKEKIKRALSAILPRYRTLLVLKYMDNMTVSDIAQKLVLTVKGTESQLFRARKAFVETFTSF